MPMHNAFKIGRKKMMQKKYINENPARKSRKAFLYGYKKQRSLSTHSAGDKIKNVNAAKPCDMSELLNQHTTRIPLSVIFP